MITILIFIYVLLCIWLLFHRSVQVPKIIWLLWLQGWEDPPYIVKCVRDSWNRHNPGWDVRLISNENLNKYVNIPYIHRINSPAAKSDIIRLYLLEKYGGVWADATMLCMKSLDSWINVPSSIWMYHGRENCNLLASWFIIAKQNSYMIKKWKEKCDVYWNDKSEPDNYFWMDSLWIDLYKTDYNFKSEWENVPKICCEDNGQAHMLAGKVNSKDYDLIQIIKDTPPYTIKLSHHDFNENDKETNGNVAIKKSLNI
jgi:hypothetical protein